jgi:cysteine desulfurase
MTHDRQKKGKHLITSSIEHHAVLHSCEYLSKHGFELTILPVNEAGQIEPDTLRRITTRHRLGFNHACQ